MVITSNSFDTIVDHVYEGGNPPSCGKISIQAPYLGEFFDKIGKGPYTLVMGHQDFGIFYQEEQPVWKNLVNMAQSNAFQEKLEGFGDSLFQNPVILWNAAEQAMLNGARFNPKDRYIISTYNFPLMTFDEIPPQIVKWYAVNSCVNEIEPLPLGVADPDLILATLDKKIVKQNKLLVCHANHTLERLLSKVYFMGMGMEANWVTAIDNKTLLKKDFYELVASHDYVLCPAGNGIDTYRLWETLYLGSTPIIDYDYQPYLQELGAIRFRTLSDINLVDLNLVKLEWSKNMQKNTELLDLGYWEERINNAR
jgi:hypothetical protein|tara:strand:- start:1880 stop:2809 length:930 start_codon:yes stop_codon:yes gene_type:complete